jgi:hypothetical protein
MNTLSSNATQAFQMQQSKINKSLQVERTEFQFSSAYKIELSDYALDQMEKYKDDCFPIMNPQAISYGRDLSIEKMN